VSFAGNATGGNATISTGNGSFAFFSNSSTGGNARFIANAGGIFDMSGLTSAGMTAGSIEGAGNYELGSKQLTVGFNNLSTAVSGVISDCGPVSGIPCFGTGLTTGGSLTKVGTGTLTLSGVNTYTGLTTINAGTLVLSGTGSIAASSGVNLGGAAGVFDISGTTAGATIASLSGVAGGTVALGAQTLTLSNASGSFAGSIGGTGGLTLAGGREVLTGSSNYTGATIVNGGTLEVDGAITNSSSVTVNAGGALTGTGLVDPPGTVTFASGSVFAPGNGTPGSSMTISGNLALQSGVQYVVQLNPATASFANVTGTATLGGATVSAVYANGSYVPKQYTILKATGGVSGTFGAVVNTNLPSGFSATLGYDANDAFLNLALFSLPAGLNVSQQNVSTALSNFFNRNGGIPMVFGTLTQAGLTQISGELPTAAQQTTFDAMNLFLGLLTDPFVAGRGNPIAPSTAASPYAEEDSASSYAANGKTRSERDAYAALYRKAPLAQAYDPRWSVWAAGFGGSQTTDGNLALGSNAATSRVFGTAIGADYLLSPRTLVGFALAGGGTNFSLANGLGSGRSDLFQAGAFVRHTAGPAYVSAALAYGWQDITTDRTVTVAGMDRLHAEFNANTFSGRVEGGYRFVTPWAGGLGLTPYAAAQFTTFDLPAYAESVLAGANTFALAYGSKSVTDPRTELGLRTDKSFAMPDGILTLRGRLAWAHDYNPDRNIAATFQTLPGASFVVSGAGQASDAALTTASVEMKWMNGWSAAGTFEGEFSSVTTSYAGKGVVRYTW
jgi:autotransporter-associated beta strand protein